MTLLSPAPSERLRRTRPRGVWLLCTSKKGKYHLLSLTYRRSAFLAEHCFALVQTKGWEVSANLSRLHVGGLRWVFVQRWLYIIQLNGSYSIYRCGDLCRTSIWHWKYTRAKGAAVSNSSECLHTIGRLLGAFKAKLQNSSLCVLAE